jgi:hypothetical protein
MTPRRLLLGCSVVAVLVIVFVLGIIIAPNIHISFGNQTTDTTTSSPTVAPGNNNNTTSGNTPITNTTTVPINNTVSCSGYDLTQDNVTKTFQGIVVPNGCVMVIQAWSSQGLPNDWPDSVGVEGVSPGTYTFTLTSGEYRITTTAGGQNQYCSDISSLKTRNLPDAHNYPINGWSC